MQFRGDGFKAFRDDLESWERLLGPELRPMVFKRLRTWRDEFREEHAKYIQRKVDEAAQKAVQHNQEADVSFGKLDLMPML